MTLARRRFLQLSAGAALLAAPGRTASAQAARPLADRLADYADRIGFSDLDAATIERVKSHLIDALGCGVAALDERPVQICREVALTPGSGVSLVIGTDRRTTPDLAAFANGVAFRYLDLNDVYVGKFAGHPSDHIAACLAVAEAEKATARELITAIVLAYEINCRLMDVLDTAARD
jgi:2-methylcitrate dehydratase